MVYCTRIKYDGCGKMNFVVLDMEWNQPGYGEAVLCKNGVCMKNEIIQIGAVKLDEQGKISDTFKRLVKPVSLTTMNKMIKQLTGITDEMLDKGEGFGDVIEDFRAWCGNEFVLLIWGCDDVRILRNNLKFYGIDERWLPQYYNVQMIFCLQTGLEKRQYALSFALEHFNISVNEDSLHDALYDAVCTAYVCEKLDLKDGIEKMKYMPSYEEKNSKTANVLIKRKFRHIKKREDIWANGFITRPACPFCGEKMKHQKPKRIGNNKLHIESHCEKDGSFMSVIKISETPQKTFSVSQQIYILDEKTKAYFEKTNSKRTSKNHHRPKKRNTKNVRSVVTGEE